MMNVYKYLIVQEPYVVDFALSIFELSLVCNLCARVAPVILYFSCIGDMSRCQFLDSLMVVKVKMWSVLSRSTS